jgi:hypothetical protein
MAPVSGTAPDGEREVTMMRWASGRRDRPFANVRNPKSPYWRGWLKAEWLKEAIEKANI